MQQHQKGFTLIELIMVIVILGILAAFALPRFADLSGDAETAKLDGALGAMKSASAISHGACLANSSCDSSIDASSVDLDGASGVAMDYGYPSGDDASDDSTTGISQAADLDGYTLTHTTDIDGAGTAGVFITNSAVSNNDDCVFYEAPTSTTAPIIGTGTVSSSTQCQ